MPFCWFCHEVAHISFKAESALIEKLYDVIFGKCNFTIIVEGALILFYLEKSQQFKLS